MVLGSFGELVGVHVDNGAANGLNQRKRLF